MSYDAARYEETDIVIVGCGPVGAMLANLLGMAGVSTIVLEREAEIYNLPRAVHFDDEIMRLLQTVGLADAMQPMVRVSPGMRFVDDSGALLLDWSRPMEVGPQGWQASYRFHQPDLERVLRDGIARHRTVSVRLRTEVFALTEEADAIYVHFEDLSTGQLSRCRTRYVVGCDGARSLVRRLIGAAMEDLGFHERWLVVDALLRRPRPDLGDYSLQYCSKDRPATYVRGTGDRRRWEITILPGDDTQAITRPDKVFELLSRWVGPEDVDLERVALYTFHSALAPIWRRGRMLIAGDSAHLTPPFLGQGMCAGMRDAANLTWKLVRVLRGQNTDDLLDTYETERKPHVREYIELAVRLGGLINTTAMQAGVPEGALKTGEVAHMRSIKPRLGEGLSKGLKVPAGQIAPQPCLEDQTRLDDRVGYNYAALLRAEFAAALPLEMRTKFSDRGMAIVTASSREAQIWLEDAGAAGVLIRPDRYILGTVDSHQELSELAGRI